MNEDQDCLPPHEFIMHLKNEFVMKLLNKSSAELNYPLCANIKTFLKWTGGKTQLICEINATLSTDFMGRELTYI